MPCDLGDPGGGIPGFRMVLCCFTHSLVWPDGLDALFRFVASPYHTVMIQSYHLLHQLTHSLMNWNLSRCCFACVGCFLVCLVLCLCVLCAFGVFVLFLLCLGDYIVTVHRTTASGA